MKIKIWRVKFGDNYTSLDIVAPNISEAIRKARISRKKVGDIYLNRIQDIIEAMLIAEED